jgi:hypothetical protein
MNKLQLFFISLKNNSGCIVLLILLFCFVFFGFYFNVKSSFEWLPFPSKWFEWLQVSNPKLSILFFTLIVVFFIFRLKHDWKIICNFLIPFVMGKKELVFGISAVIIFVIVSSILVHFYKSKGNIDYSFFNLAPFILCIVGIYLTSRVYLEIQEDKTVTLKDYLKILNYIISSSTPDDKILIIAPTIILGQADKNELHQDGNYIYIIDTYFDKILRHLESGEIYFALLDFDYKNFKNFKVNKTGSDKATYKTYNEFGEITNKPLSNYHFESYLLRTDKQDELDNFMEHALAENLRKLNSTSKANFIRLKPEMYFTSKIGTQSSGFFAVANFDRGMYYMGTYEHDKKTYNFHGTYFRNEHIRAQMLSMLKVVFDGKLESETDEEKAKIENFFTI